LGDDQLKNTEEITSQHEKINAMRSAPTTDRTDCFKIEASGISPSQDLAAGKTGS